MFKKSFLILVIVSLISLLTLAGCNNNKPEIKINITLDNITNEEYKKFNENNKPEGIAINDLIKLSVNATIINSKKAVERNINIPDLFAVINNYDNKARGLSGGTAVQNNIGTESTAETSAYVIFDRRDMSDQDIINLYNNSDIIFSYKLKDSELNENKISIGKNMKIIN